MTNVQNAPKQLRTELEKTLDAGRSLSLGHNPPQRWAYPVLKEHEKDEVRYFVRRVILWITLLIVTLYFAYALWKQPVFLSWNTLAVVVSAIGGVVFMRHLKTLDCPDTETFKTAFSKIWKSIIGTDYKKYSFERSLLVNEILACMTESDLAQLLDKERIADRLMLLSAPLLQQLRRRAGKIKLRSNAYGDNQTLRNAGLSHDRNVLANLNALSYHFSISGNVSQNDIYRMAIIRDEDWQELGLEPQFTDDRYPVGVDWVI
ncbi:MAG: hypothetical protein RL094_325 [Candidatus Parcubacteria bacterium]|jgi:hypothetical protein